MPEPMAYLIESAGEVIHNGHQLQHAGVDAQKLQDLKARTHKRPSLAAFV